MNDMQFKRLTELAQTGADHARAGKTVLVLDYRAKLGGWWECANYARDEGLARTAQRATTWVDCTHDHCRGLSHSITDVAAKLMWGDES